MLWSLLPGLRDARAPLVSGAMMLVAIILGLGNRFQDLTEPTSRSDTLNSLINWTGRPGATAVFLLTAYFIGSIVAGFSRRVAVARSLAWITRRIKKLKPQSFGQDTLNDLQFRAAVLLMQMFGQVDQSLKGRARAFLLPFHRDGAQRASVEYIKLSAKKHGADPSTWSTKYHVETLLTDVVKHGGRRLRAEGPVHYMEYDRLQSEAELRNSLHVPLLAVVIAVASNVQIDRSLQVAAGIVIMMIQLFLFTEALRLDRTAHDLVLSLVAEHECSLPCLDDLDWRKQLTPQEKYPPPGAPSPEGPVDD